MTILNYQNSSYIKYINILTIALISAILFFTGNLIAKDFVIDGKYLSKNFQLRIKQIVLHHTAEGFEGSLVVLDGKTKRKVSSHYLINNKPTKRFPNYIYRLVPDDEGSYNAGISFWGRDDDLDNSTIGIEIVNLDGNKHPYPNEQIEAVMFLVKKLIKDYNIEAVNVVGHSDVAPARKIDPGKLFPWKRLYENGIGAWYDDADVKMYQKKITSLPNINLIKTHLRLYGYGVDINNNSFFADDYKNVVKAFQRHFATEKIDGVMSLENYHILRALLKKYREIE